MGWGVAHGYTISSIPTKYKNMQNRSIWLKDETPTDTTTPGQSGPWSTDNILHTPQSSRIGASPPDAV